MSQKINVHQAIFDRMIAGTVKGAIDLKPTCTVQDAPASRSDAYEGSASNVKAVQRAMLDAVAPGSG
jgi:hypothetical protein